MRALIVSAVRNEAPFLLEWIAHHRAIGASDFLLYSNGCEDGTVGLLAALDTAGIVMHRPIPLEGRKAVQWRALAAARDEPAYGAADWIVALDCDEFINPHPPLASLADLVAAAGEPDAIAMRWRLFGSDGRAAFEDRPVTATFTAAAPEPCAWPPDAAFFKTLFRRAGPFDGPGVHRPRVVDGATPVWVDGSGGRLDPAVAGDARRVSLGPRAGPQSLVQVNHYALRSAESFLVKRARGLPNHRDREVGLAYWVERNFNTDRDESILRHADATSRERRALEALPGVTAAHAAGVAWHREKIRAILDDMDEHRLYSQLLLAAGSRPPDAPTGEALWRGRQRAFTRRGVPAR